MATRPRTIVAASFIAAVVVFCVVQDRTTAAGARQYVALQRAALAGRGAPVTIDGVVAPAVARSVRLGLLYGGVVWGLGLAAATVQRRRLALRNGLPSADAVSEVSLKRGIGARR